MVNQPEKQGHELLVAIIKSADHQQTLHLLPDMEVDLTTTEIIQLVHNNRCAAAQNATTKQPAICLRTLVTATMQLIPIT